jgi:hypothetical protein
MSARRTGDAVIGVDLGGTKCHGVLAATDVPIPVPTLKARASSNPIGGSGFVAPSHIASATSPTYT